MVEAPAKLPPVQVSIPMYNTSTLRQANVSVLYQGAPGSGKTFNMASWPSPFFLYFDTNLMGLAKFDGIPYVTVQDWQEVERIWIPAIKNRRLTEYVRGLTMPDGSHPFATYKVRTLCIDSLTFMVNKNVLELGDGGAKSLGFDGWDKYYGRLHTLLTVATQATLPINSKPDAESYHVLASVHEDKITDDDGKLTSIAPSIQGKMRSHIAAFFNAVLLTESVTANVQVPQPNGSMATEQRKLWHAYSIAPNRLREAKDQISGGRFGQLPAKVGGTYEVLNSYWKLEPTGG